MPEEAMCGQCGRSFPKEHITVCLIGDVLCPPCEVKQERYPSSAIMDNANFAFGLSSIVNTGIECQQHDDCPCSAHQIDRRFAAHEAEAASKEEERMQQVREWAALPIYA